MSTALIIVAAALLVILCWARLGLLSPVTITVLLWLVIGLLFVARPFHVFEPSMRVSVAVVAGLTALCLPPLLLPWPRPRVPSHQPEGPQVRARVWALALATAVVLAAALYGVLAYRAAVSAALGGVPFSQLDPNLVRWAELYGNAKLSSSAALALGLTPLLGAVAVIGGLTHRWWWYLLLPVTLLIVTESPSRTATLSVVVSSVFFFLLLAKAQVGASRRPRRRLRPAGLLALVAATAAGALGYFSYIGHALGKSGVAPGLFPARWVPSALVEPLMFQLGGLSAFTAELAHPILPGGPYGHFGRSMYSMVKLADILGFHVPQPDPFAGYVNIPVPFNTYSAFGDIYSDLGLAGIVALFLLMGLVVHVFSRWPWPGHPVSAWVLSTMAVVLTSTPVNMRFLDVDIVAQTLVGALMLALVLRRQPSPVASGGVDATGQVPAEPAPRPVDALS